MKVEPTNQYMFLVHCSPCHQKSLSPEQIQEHMTEVFSWIDRLTKQGLFSAAQPLTSEGKIVSEGSGDEIIVTDGVFAESKESVGGFFIVNTQTMDEAVEIARSSPMLKHGGMLEVRRIAELKSETA